MQDHACPLPFSQEWIGQPPNKGNRPKRVAIFQIRSSRFRSLFPTHVVVAKPLHSFARHALDVTVTRSP
ncbi:hypothetical protein ELI54_19740 [Rhizobium ruizarguesonis]|uniref:Uncharacterized protein n=1 Tax=Rhizobium ruizarguesonis TaxID=2081791 RepID=A0AB38I8Q5_9HYPH|nr:hypothetical protein ELI56_19825 [Rhizobium ruizarguesonis]TAT90287.1 hypothetical protein ELI54_19740 [Rhizobium ruizarguesonis]TAY81071.1 hypothetical protein ELH86_19865 [Rhizobium ruizarguesonis]TAY95678.1 hypothetical protein ELH85_21935 [Rhizobium ruizarguesonis]TAZ36730.1 hypothetical protein ELH80_21290 [Rhizobium ruizarguesonis]